MNVSTLAFTDALSRSKNCTGMVLFYCTAVAMKRQDQNGISDGLEDFFEPGEKMEFSGLVYSSDNLEFYSNLMQ